MISIAAEAPETTAGPPADSHANSITVEGLGLVFPSGFVGLKSTSLHIRGGEFCTMLGPSGSGKTTLLRAIAGLAMPSYGRVLVGKRDVTHLPIQARNIGFVFQNYALFPHMNVAENIEYPLRLHKWPAAERAGRVGEILDLIELPAARDRAVGELSGGQQQRVAIGRALAYRPSLLLLDEPMGALDRRLRQQLGAQLREIQQRTGITAVYVTHDQEEAFILSDKIAVMDRGEILQYSTPDELYFRPRSRFVAKFLGEANLIDVSALAPSALGGHDVETAYGTIHIPRSDATDSAPAALAVVVRPEDISLTDQPAAAAGRVDPIPVEIVRELFLGSRCMVTARAPDGHEILVECSKSQIPAPGSQAWISWKHDASVLVKR